MKSVMTLHAYWLTTSNQQVTADGRSLHSLPTNLYSLLPETSDRVQQYIRFIGVTGGRVGAPIDSCTTTNPFAVALLLQVKRAVHTGRDSQ